MTRPIPASQTPSSLDDTLPLPTHSAFEPACRAFLTKYAAQTPSSSPEPPLGPERTNRGWQWREHKSVPHHGYLFRRTTRYADARGDTASPLGEELEEVDVTQRLHPSPGRSRVEIEHHIVYSRTYHTPMLCLRSWDEAGAPLSLSRMISTNLTRAPSAPALFPPYAATSASSLQPSPHARTETFPQPLVDPKPIPAAASLAEPIETGSSPGPVSDTAILIPSSPFPLLQQTDHPTTGDLVWSVHPCLVAGAVGEILRSERSEQSDPLSLEDPDEMGVRWLEAWMMLSNGVVDLSWP